MTAEGLTAPLALTALAVGLACVVVLRPCVGLRAAFLLAVVKVGITTAFFTFTDTGAWQILDDVTYTEEAARLLAGGFGVGRILANPLAPEVVEAARGLGVGYYVMNVLAQSLFGAHYWSAVFVNVLLSCVAARALHRLLVLGEVPRSYRLGLLVFFLLHWDVLAWSSFLNLKDTLVLALASWMCAWGAMLLRRPALVPFLWLAANALLLYFVRFYVPLVFLAVFGAALAWTRRGIWSVLFLLGLGVVALRGVAVDLTHVDVSAPLAGAVAFLVTPRPWAVSENYGFLVLPSLLHWLTAPLAVLGALSLWRRVVPARLALVFGLALVAFYGVVPHLVGPRHRYQLIFLLAWLQFEGAHRLATHALALRRRRAPLAAAAAGG